MKSRETRWDWALLARQARRDARARFGDLADLDDLVQDALVLLLERQQTVESPRAWVRAAVWRLLANCRRSVRPEPLPSRQAWDSPRAPEADLRVDLLAAARRLPLTERHLLKLLAVGFSHREIAEYLRVGSSSVGARVQRMRRRLHRFLSSP